VQFSVSWAFKACYTQGNFFVIGKMCDTWGRQNPARHRPQRESLDLFHARARVERSKGRADLKDALERFVRPDAKRSGVTSR